MIKSNLNIKIKIAMVKKRVRKWNANSTFLILYLHISGTKKKQPKTYKLTTLKNSALIYLFFNFLAAAPSQLSGLGWGS